MKVTAFLIILVMVAGPLAQPLMVHAQSAPLQGPTQYNGVTLDQLSQLQGPTQSGQPLGTVAAGTNQNTQASNSNGANDTLGCGITSGQKIAICISNLVYYVMVGLFSNIAYICAYFFDITVELSLNSIAYSLDFLNVGWSMVRDLANMAFLFIIIYIAFIVIFKAETSNTLRMLAAVIVVALLVNFSFFFTRVAIDAGNILAVQFYNAIQAPIIGANNSTCGSPTSGSNQTAPGTGKATKDLTWPIMCALNVQGLTSDKTFQQYVQNSDGTSSAMYTLIILSLIYIATGIMFAILAGSFLFSGAKFMIRMATLWFLIVASPAAFVAAAVAKTKEGGTNWFNRWFSSLIKFSFYPAIYLFMFMIITKFMNGLGGNILGSLFQKPAGESTATLIASGIATVVVRMGFIVAVMYLALSVSEMLVNEGSQAAGAIQGKMLSGLTGGIVGFAGRNTFGRGAQLFNRVQEARGKEPSRVGTFLSTKTYDPRNLPGVKPVLKNVVEKPVERLRSTVGKNALPLDLGQPQAGKPWGGAGLMSRILKPKTPPTPVAANDNGPIQPAATPPVAANDNDQSQQSVVKPIPAVATGSAVTPSKAIDGEIVSKLQDVESAIHLSGNKSESAIKKLIYANENSSAETPTRQQTPKAQHNTGATLIQLPDVQPEIHINTGTNIDQEKLAGSIANAVKSQLKSDNSEKTEAIPLSSPIFHEQPDGSFKKKEPSQDERFRMIRENAIDADYVEIKDNTIKKAA